MGTVPIRKHHRNGVNTRFLGLVFQFGTILADFGKIKNNQNRAIFENRGRNPYVICLPVPDFSGTVPIIYICLDMSKQNRRRQCALLENL